MFSFKILEEKYRSIPSNVREAISSTDVNQKLQDIVNKYKLQFDEGEELTKEIGYVMLGLKSSDDFVKNIQRATELNKETAEKIAEDVNNIIFKDIKSSLKELTQKTEEKDDFGKEERKEIRSELMQEIEDSKEKTTDIIKRPKQTTSLATHQKEGEGDILSKPLEKEAEEANNNSTPQPLEQHSLKNYTIDPYREPIE